MGQEATANADLAREADAAVERVLTGSGITLKELASVPVGIRELRGAIADFKTHAVEQAEARFAEKLTGSIDDKIKTIFGDSAGQRLLDVEEKLKKIDRSGSPGRPTIYLAGETERKHDIYSAIGRAGVQAWMARDGVPSMTRAGQLALTDNKGGAAVPQITVEDFFYVMLDHCVARQMLPPTRQFPLDESLTVIFPTISTRPDSTGGATEGQAGTGTDATFVTRANSSITASIIKGWIPFSKAAPPRLLERMQAVIGEMLLEDIGNQEDQWFFNSSSPFTGMLQAATGTAAVMDSGLVDFTDLENPDFDAHKFFAKLKRGINPNHIGRGVYAMNPEIWTIVEGLTDKQNRPLYGTGSVGAMPGAQLPAPVSVPTELRLLNRPVYTTTAMPGISASAADTAFILYMDPSAAAIAAREPEVQVDESVEAKEVNRVFIAWELFALKLMLTTCAATAKTAAA